MQKDGYFEESFVNKILKLCEEFVCDVAERISKNTHKCFSRFFFRSKKRLGKVRPLQLHYLNEKNVKKKCVGKKDFFTKNNKFMHLLIH